MSKTGLSVLITSPMFLSLNNGTKLSKKRASSEPVIIQTPELNLSFTSQNGHSLPVASLMECLLYLPRTLLLGRERRIERERGGLYLLRCRKEKE